MDRQSSLGNETVNKLRAIFKKHNDERVCVVGTMCCGKTTLIKQLSGYGCIDMDDEFWPQTPKKEYDYYSQRPFTKAMYESLYELFRKRLSVGIASPLFGIYILDCDVIVYIDISEEDLKNHCDRRGDTNFIDACNLKKWIEEDCDKYRKRKDTRYYHLTIDQ